MPLCFSNGVKSPRGQNLSPCPPYVRQVTCGPLEAGLPKWPSAESGGWLAVGCEAPRRLPSDRGPEWMGHGGVVVPGSSAASTLRAGRPGSFPGACVALPLPAGQDDALQHVCGPAGRHLQPLHIVSEVVLDRGQGLARPCGPLEGTGGPQPEKTAPAVLFHEES